MINNVLLKGYYGAGNLGDDILMLVSLSLIKEFYQTDQIIIWGAKLASLDFQYINQIANQQLQLTTYTDISVEKENTLVLGGGGLFFQFDNSSPQIIRTRSSSDANTTSILLKNQSAHKQYSLTLNDHFIHRFAIGLGVGPFCANSDYYKLVAEYLSKFELVTLRDPISYNLCRSWGVRKKYLPQFRFSLPN